jgi:WD40 repeat protein
MLPKFTMFFLSSMLLSHFSCHCSAASAAKSETRAKDQTILDQYFLKPLQQIIAGYVEDEWFLVRELTGGGNVMAFSPDEQEIAYQPKMDTISRLNLKNNTENRLKTKIESCLGHSILSSDSNYLVSCECSIDKEAQLDVCDMRLNSQIMTQTLINGALLSLAISPDNKYIACAFHNVIKIINITEEKCSSIAFDGCVLSDLAFSSDSKYVALCSARLRGNRLDQKKLEVIELDTEKIITCSALATIDAKITALEFMPIGHLLSIGTDDGHIVIIDINKNEVASNQKISMLLVSRIYYPKNGKYALVQVKDFHNESISIWDIKFTRCFKIFNKKLTQHAAFSSTGRYVALSNIDSLEIWENQTAQLLSKNHILYDSCAYCCIQKNEQNKLKRCSDCKKMWYCNETCKNAHRDTHENICKLTVASELPIYEPGIVYAGLVRPPHAHDPQRIPLLASIPLL